MTASDSVPIATQYPRRKAPPSPTGVDAVIQRLRAEFVASRYASIPVTPEEEEAWVVLARAELSVL